MNKLSKLITFVAPSNIGALTPEPYKIDGRLVYFRDKTDRSVIGNSKTLRHLFRLVIEPEKLT